MTGRDFVHRGFGGVAVPGDIAAGVILVPTRAEAAALAAGWEGSRLVADHYAWQVWTGAAGGVRLTACSTGTGSASAAVAIEELAILGAQTVLGVGATLGEPDPSGAVAIAEGAVRFDAASLGYARAGFPAVPDVDITLAAYEAARDAGLAVRTVVVADIEAGPDAVAGSAEGRSPEAAAVAGVLATTGAVPVDASPAVLFVMGTVHGLRTGFLAASGRPEAQARLRAVAVDALVRLASADGGGDGRTGPGAEGPGPGAEGPGPGAEGPGPGAEGRDPGAEGRDPGAEGRDPGAS